MVLYLSFDGLLQPIGQANVTAYLRRLARAGFRIRVLSLEQRERLANPAAATALRRELAADGMEWIAVPYARGGAAAAARNLTRLALAAWRASGPEVELLHARSLPPAVAAMLLALARRRKYIFDMRAYWVDEKRATGRWFTRRWIYAAAKCCERTVIRRAAAVVTLTALQADDLRPLAAEVCVVPTCTDYDFWRDRGGAAVPQTVRARLASKLVVAYVGSHTNSYLVEESARLFGYVHALRPDSHLLCLSYEPAALAAAMRAAGLEEGSWSLHAVDHADMPAWLALAQWGLLLLRAGVGKRGSMPTKLAEFFAAGVRPVQYGCNAEVAAWVARAGSGLVLDDVSDAGLRAAAARIAAAPADAEALERARAVTRPYFGLDAGVATYAGLYRRLGLRDAAAAVPAPAIHG